MMKLKQQTKGKALTEFLSEEWRRKHKQFSHE